MIVVCYYDVAMTFTMLVVSIMELDYHFIHTSACCIKVYIKLSLEDKPLVSI